MRWSSGVIALAAETALVTAQLETNSSSSDPCSVLTSRAASYLSESPNATTVFLKPSEVYACLRSVPYDKGKSTDQITWIQNILQFQSTLAYLKSPTPSYPLPAVDLVGGLKNISTTITSGKYTNEYDIELDIYNLLRSANDGHLKYTPFLLGAFAYARNISLVSVSLDGVQIPRVYLKADIVGMSGSNFTPSAVTTINGQDIGRYVNQFGQGMQDLDALYNSAFYSPATAAAPLDRSNINALFTEHRDTTICTFENGTSKEIEATAVIPRSYATTLLGNAQSIFNLLTSAGENSTSSSMPPSSPPSLPLGPNFPTPFVKSDKNLISGYFMNGTENSDVAVLNVASFHVNATDDAERTEYLQVSSDFLAKCASAGKRRLIVDLRNNPGGLVSLGYALFQQLFPHVEPYSGVRMRGSDAINALGDIASKSPAESSLGATFPNDRLLLQPNGTSFESWQRLYGPLQQHGDLFSNVGIWEALSSDLGPYVASLTRNTTKLPPQAFPSRSITILTDGQCSSTCADFANLMINQGRVKSVTVGGRPNNKPMTVIGGTQGAYVLPLPSLQSFAQEAIELQANATGNLSTQSQQTRKLLQMIASPPPISPLPVAEAVSVNLLDNIAQKDTSMTPLQFTGGIPANCRFYYMPADITNVTNTWARVARGVKAGGKGLCVNGTMTAVSPHGSNGSAPLAFQGSGSSLGTARVGWAVVLVAFVSVAAGLL